MQKKYVAETEREQYLLRELYELRRDYDHVVAKLKIIEKWVDDTNQFDDLMEAFTKANLYEKHETLQ